MNNSEKKINVYAKTLIAHKNKTIEQLVNEKLAYWNNDNQEYSLTEQGYESLFGDTIKNQTSYLK